MSKTFQPDSLHPYIMDARLKKATGSGGISNIPIASADTVGGIMIGGSANPITITGSGNASVRKATSELLGVVKAGDGVSIDAAGAISGIAYSTTEHKTGRKWIDGKDIYEKTVSLGALPNTNEIQIDHGITFDTVIDYIAIAQNSVGVVLKLPFLSPTSSNNVGASINATKVTVFTGSDRSGFTGYCTIQYTKPITP